MNCQPDNHRWEYFGVQQGLEWDRCMVCGETRLSGFHDIGSGGFVILLWPLWLMAIGAILILGGNSK